MTYASMPSILLPALLTEYSVKSFENIAVRIKDIMEVVSDVPMILVGCKQDLPLPRQVSAEMRRAAETQYNVCVIILYRSVFDCYIM